MMVPNSLHATAIASLSIQKADNEGMREAEDVVAVEEPLEIRLVYGPETARIEQSVSVTMRTPGHDAQLAIGFLFTEGIIHETHSILFVKQDAPVTEQSMSGNAISISLDPRIKLDLGKLNRHFYTTSSCGVCGKASISAIKTICPDLSASKGNDPVIRASVLYSLPERLRHCQDIFAYTGGIHASALFDTHGNILSAMEDIGRHNALDKLIGKAFLDKALPLQNHILLLSGRACFELIQKAAMAGIRIVAAIGPPSSLAVELARENDMTLVGFLKEQRFNIYTGAQRFLPE